MHPEPDIARAGADLFIVLGIWAVIIVVSVIGRIIKKLKEADTGVDRRPAQQPPQQQDLWGDGRQAARPAAQPQRPKPPPVPARHRVKVKRSTSVSQQQAAEARRVMEQALQRQQQAAARTDDSNYDADEAYEEDAYEDRNGDAYEIGGRKRRKRGHKVLEAMRGRAGARMAVIAREVLERPRAFDI